TEDWDNFIIQAQKLLNIYRTNKKLTELAPIPLQAFEQNFSISSTWVNDAKILKWGNYIPVNTPYGINRGVVHPQILEFPNKFLGYRYIVVITGYTNGNLSEENPFLLGSNDLENFNLVSGIIDQPEIPQNNKKDEAYNSDPFIFYDVKTNELVLIIREFWTNYQSTKKNHEFLYIRRTKDGKNWSSREILFEPHSGMALSPSILFDAKTETYHMYFVGNAEGKNFGLQHFTSQTLKNDWQYINTIPTPNDTSIWHIDCKNVGDKQLCIFQNRVRNNSIGFRLGISSDYYNFIWSNNWLNSLDKEVYKATFLPQFNEKREMRLMVLWTTNSKYNSDSYKLYAQPTQYMNVNYLKN
ncbi:hypothetical protein OFM92_12195, partial [Acinetobacter baumannii]|nr:hypothetical protein [Acinetobacter baumannii]